jgi:CheY-like chemotaxis protein
MPADAPLPPVLVADGSVESRRALCSALARLRVSVLQAGSAREALAVCLRRPEPVLLALVDARLPGLGGPETVAALHRVRPGLASCLLTAGPVNSCRTPWGVGAVLAKPVRPRPLLRVLQHLKALLHS